MKFTGESDICQRILHRYSKSIAPEHLHLCAIASAFCSESLPLTPLDCFTAIIDSSKTAHDADAVCGIASFLALVLPLVPNKCIDMSMAAKATGFVVDLADNPCDRLQVSSVRDLVKCLGLLLELCNLDDWKSVQLGFPTLIKYAIDKRAKVRKCAQGCVVKVFNSFQSPVVKNNASKLVLKTFKTYMSSAIGSDGSKVDEQLEVCHKLELLKLLIPCLPSEVISEAIVELQNSLSAKFSPPLMMHVLDVMEEILQFFESESKPTVIAKLKIADKWSRHYSFVIGFITGLLAYKATDTRASNILRRMLTRVDLYEDLYRKKLVIVDSLCEGFVQVLNTHSDDKGTPNEPTLAIISDTFRILGTHMENIFVKLVSFMPVALASGNSCDVKHLRECIGTGVTFMGPEVAIPLIPISFNATDLTFSNTWFIPILEEYTCRSHLRLFIETILPLASSFLRATKKGKKKGPEIKEQLQSYAHDCWRLLPAFCRQPFDMRENFGYLTKLLIPYIKKDSFMLENISTALQHLVIDNLYWSSLDDDKDDDEEPPKLPRAYYEKEVAARNVKALSSSSEALLRAFTQVFFQVLTEKRAFVKDTIRCLALVTEYSRIKKIFSSSLKQNVSVEKDRADANRCLLVELALSFDPAISICPTDLIYDFIEECLQEDDANIQSEAYATLYKVLVESSEFMPSKFEQLVDLLLDLKTPVDITSLRCRFSCFRALLVHSIEITRDRENTHCVCMLNEIVVTLEDSKEERRKVAEDILRETSSILKKTSSFKRKRAPYYEFIAMIIGHLSASSPCVKSGAVSALSLLISDDSEICHLMPDLVSEILELLDSEDIQVTKAVLGFLKVLVLRLEARDLQMFLADILEELVPWSSVSQHHIKSEVALIFEIMMRKCGSAPVIKSLVPEKYRDFGNNVLKNRQRKTNSVEDVCHR